MNFILYKKCCINENEWKNVYVCIGMLVSFLKYTPKKKLDFQHIIQITLLAEDCKTY